jgi:hypothetical protein
MTENLNSLPIYTKQEVYPPHLNLPFSKLRGYYIFDVKRWIHNNKKLIREYLKIDNISPHIHRNILNDPYSILSKEMVKSLFTFEKSELRKYSDKLSDHFVELHDKYKHPIFGPNMTLEEIIREFLRYNEQTDEQSIEFARSDYPGEKFLNSINRVSSVVNHWFPEIYECLISGNKYTLIEQVRNKDLFYARIHRIVGLDKFKIRNRTPDAPISRFLNTYMKVTNGNQIAYNFPLPLAKWLYKRVLSKEKFKDKQDIYVADMSMGWGGRLSGLLSALNPQSDTYKLDRNKNYHYWGTDVNTVIKDRYSMLYNFWKEQIDKYRWCRRII